MNLSYFSDIQNQNFLFCQIFWFWSSFAVKHLSSKLSWLSLQDFQIETSWPFVFKIFRKLLVSTTNSHATITEKFMHYIVNLFSPELKYNSWNQRSQFNIHNAPNKNLAVGFRKEGFNRFVYLCDVILCLDPFICSFLSKLSILLKIWHVLLEHLRRLNF